MAEKIWQTTEDYLLKDIPELASLSLNTLRKSKLFPSSYKAFFQYTQGDWIDIIPVLSTVFVVVSSIFIFLSSWISSKETTRPRPQYQKVRSYLIRLQSLCYASGFLTSAIQHRALWGENGKNKVV